MADPLPALNSARGVKQTPPREDGIVIWDFDIGTGTLSIEGDTCSAARTQARAWVDTEVARLTAAPDPSIAEKLASSLDTLDPSTATVADVIASVQSAVSA